MIQSWDRTIEAVEDTVDAFDLPRVAILSAPSETDILPSDPTNISGKELADRLFEYSGYVSFLDAEKGRAEAEALAIENFLNDIVDAISYESKLSKAKSRSQLLRLDDSACKAANRLSELQSLSIRLQGLRDGFAVRMQAVSREITRRGQEQ